MTAERLLQMLRTEAAEVGEPAIGSSAREAVAVAELLREERVRIAGKLEVLGCRGVMGGCYYRLGGVTHGNLCPIAIAAAIRRGDL